MHSSDKLTGSFCHSCRFRTPIALQRTICYRMNVHVEKRDLENARGETAFRCAKSQGPANDAKP